MKKIILIISFLVLINVVSAYDYNWIDGTDGNMSNRPSHFTLFYNATNVSTGGLITVGNIHNDTGSTTTLEKSGVIYNSGTQTGNVWSVNSTTVVSSGNVSLMLDIINISGTGAFPQLQSIEISMFEDSGDKCGQITMHRSDVIGQAQSFDYYDSSYVTKINFADGQTNINYSRYNYTFIMTYDLNTDIYYIRTYYRENGTRLTSTTTGTYTLSACNDINKFYLKHATSDQFVYIGNIRMYQGFSYPVPNTMPVANVTLENKPLTVNDDLNATITFSDADNDTWSKNETRWYNDTFIESGLDNLTRISSTNTSNGETWTVSARVFDGTDWSEWVNDSVTIDDVTAPTTSSFALESTAITTSQTNNISIVCSDAESSIDFVRFQITKPNEIKNVSTTLSTSGGTVTAWDDFDEVANVGTYNVTHAYCQDLSGNLNTTLIGEIFTVSAPSPPSTGGGGGGGDGDATFDCSTVKFRIETLNQQNSTDFDVAPNKFREKNLLIFNDMVNQSLEITLSCSSDSIICNYVNFTPTINNVTANVKKPSEFALRVTAPPEIQKESFFFSVIGTSPQNCQRKLSANVNVGLTLFSLGTKPLELRLSSFGSNFEDAIIPAIIPAFILAIIVFTIVQLIFAKGLEKVGTGIIVSFGLSLITLVSFIILI